MRIDFISFVYHSFEAHTQKNWSQIVNCKLYVQHLVRSERKLNKSG